MRLRLVLGAALLLILASEPIFACQVAGNLVINCGFPTNVLSWTFNGTPTHEPNDGSSALGSANVVSTAGPNLTIGQCVAVSASTTYGYGIDYRLISGSPTGCTLGITFRDAASCLGNVTASAFIDFTPSGAWAQTSDSLNSGAGAASAFLQAGCGGAVGTLFTMRFDDGFLGVGLVPVELQGFEVE